MKKEKYPCPCGGKVKWKRREIIQNEVNCGVLDVEVCNKCGSEYFPEESMSVIEAKLKDAGLWGIKREEVTLWKSGSSVIIRVPTGIAKELNLKPQKKVMIYPERTNKLVVEV